MDEREYETELLKIGLEQRRLELDEKKEERMKEQLILSWKEYELDYDKEQRISENQRKQRGNPDTDFIGRTNYKGGKNKDGTTPIKGFGH